MKWDFDGIALTPKLCDRCGKKFIFKRYKKYLQTRVFGCYAYDYICHDCYSAKNKEKDENKGEN